MKCNDWYICDSFVLLKHKVGMEKRASPPRIRASPRVCGTTRIQFLFRNWKIFFFFTFTLEKLSQKTNALGWIITTTNINWMLHNPSINLLIFLTYPLPNISTIIYSKLYEKYHIQHPIFSSPKLDQKGVSRKL